MAVPKKRVSKSKRNMRRSHLSQENPAPGLSVCPRCKEPKLPHRVCVTCGHYGKREVINMES